MRETAQKVGIGIFPLLAGVMVALVIIAIILQVEAANLRDVWEALYSGSWDGGNKRARVLQSWLPLLLCSSGLLLTFTAGLWNIGIEGQLTMGAIGASLVALFVEMPNRELQIALSLLMAACTAAGWGLVAGILKTRGGVNEIFGGVALNFIAALFLAFLIGGPWSPGRGATGSRTAAFDAFALLPAVLVERAYLSYLAVGVGVGAFVVVAVILYFTRFGLQLKAIGKSQPSAQALGVPTERNMWLAMTLCGACAGLGGSILVLHPPTGQLQASASGGIGFLALLVVLLASIRPWLVPIIAFVFAFLNVGAQRVESSLRVDSSLVNVLQGVLVLAVLLFDGIRQRIETAQERRAVALEAARVAQRAEEGIQS